MFLIVVMYSGKSLTRRRSRSGRRSLNGFLLKRLIRGTRNCAKLEQKTRENGSLNPTKLPLGLKGADRSVCTASEYVYAQIKTSSHDTAGAGKSVLMCIPVHLILKANGT
jgi:hypothetical protein